PAGATAEAYAAVTVQGTVEGTRVGFIINKFSGLLRCVSETGYWDDAAVEIAYDPVEHLFLRLAEDGTNLTWATSPDGSAWTTQRTLATPGWIAADAELCALDMSAHRDADDDVAEGDSIDRLSAAGVRAVSATPTASAGLTAGTPTIAAGAAATLAAETGLWAPRRVTASMSASLTGVSTLTAHAGAPILPEVAELSAGDWDLYIEQGATFLQRFTVEDDPAFTWDGWTARSQIRSEASAAGA